jgi:hypothetical protein
MTQQRVARIENFDVLQAAPFKASGLSFPQKASGFSFITKTWSFLELLFEISI